MSHLQYLFYVPPFSRKIPDIGCPGKSYLGAFPVDIPRVGLYYFLAEETLATPVSHSPFNPCKPPC